MAKYRVDIPAGPIWNQQDAEVKAPRIAAAHLGKWTGQWTTVVPNEMSVVGVEFDVPLPNTGNTYTQWVIAGPIWSNDEAQTLCPAIAASYQGKWTGQWKTVIEGVMSVCELTFHC
jgi:hypothetical protein